MKKIILLTVAVAMFIALPLSAAHAVETFAIETETRIYNPEKSYGGYFLTSRIPGGTTYLMDMMGNVVHKWDNVGAVPRLLPNGNLSCYGQHIAAAKDPVGVPYTGLMENTQLRDWDNNPLWSFNPKVDLNLDYGMNHDGFWMWNKKLQQYTFLLFVDRNTTKEEIVAAGGDPTWDYTNRLIGQGCFIEVNWDKEIVWQWEYIDHTCQSKNPAWPRYVSDVSLAPGKCDMFHTTDAQGPEGREGVVTDWHHTNSMDYNEELDHIVMNAKHWSEFYVIDHGKTFVSTTDWAANKAAAAGPDGDFIYRFGKPSAYNQGMAPGFLTEGEQQMYGSHDIQWIKPYLWDRPHAEAGPLWQWPDPVGYTGSDMSMPGAGNFLIFDNGCYNPTGYRSRILEINPYLNAEGVNTGAYVNPPEAGYTRRKSMLTGIQYKSNQVVWSYQSFWPNSFYSWYISGQNRLPNGNTSITSGAQGHLFEVTPTGEVVWDYIYPGFAGPTVKTVVKDTFQSGTSMYRHYRYPVDYPAFIGKDLSPIDTLTGRLPRLVGEDLTYPEPVPITGWGIPPGASSEGGGDVGEGGGGGGY